MGVRGLLSYIQECAHDTLEWHKLHNCNLFIDGSNLAFEIYCNSPNLHSAFGGDYDKYAFYVEEFLRKLIQCKIVPCIVMDGGHSIVRDKFDSLYERLAKQIQISMEIHPRRSSNSTFFPCFARSVFVNVAQKLGIRVLQTDFEADDEIAFLAKKFNGYVLSNDSDFFLFNVPVILLNSINMNFLQRENDERGKKIKFIPCYLFKPDTFCEMTKIHPEMLPLLALVAGNDYLSYLRMNKFYSSIEHLRPKSNQMSERHKSIAAGIAWLSKKGTNKEKALNEIVAGFTGKDSTKKKKKFLKSVVQMYYPTESVLTSWMMKHPRSCPASNEAGNLKQYSSASLSRIDFKAKRFIPPKVEWELTCTCESRTQTELVFDCQLPSWFVRSYRLCLVSPFIADLMNKTYLFLSPLLEQEKRNSVYLPFEPIIRKIRGVMWLTLRQSLQMSNPSPEVGLPTLQEPLTHSRSREASESFSLETKNELNSKNNSVSDDLEKTEFCIDVNPKQMDCDSSLASDDLPKSFVQEGDISNDSSDLKEEKNDDDNDNEKVEERSTAKKYTNVEDEEEGGGLIAEKYTDEEEEEERVLTTEVEEGRFSEEEEDIGEEMPSMLYETENEEDYEVLKERIKLREKWRENIKVNAFQKKGIIPALRLFVRKNTSVFAQQLEPEPINKYLVFPSLFDVARLTKVEKKKMFSMLSGVKIKFGEEIPPNVEFILLCICHWRKTTKKHTGVPDVFAVLMCVIMFCIVDGKTDRIRSKKGFKTINVTKNKVLTMLRSGNLADPSTLSLSDLIQNLTREECLLAGLSLYQFHEFDPSVQYIRTVVHNFSSFQAGVTFMMFLNNITSFPYPSISIDSFWSGSFCYNVRTFFTKNKNVNLNLSAIFNENTRIIHLINRLYSLIHKQSFLPPPDMNCDQPDIPKKLSKGKRKRLGVKTPAELGISTQKNVRNPNKKAKIAREDASEECDVYENPSLEDLELMAENRFSALFIK